MTATMAAPSQTAQQVALGSPLPWWQLLSSRGQTYYSHIEGKDVMLPAWPWGYLCCRGSADRLAHLVACSEALEESSAADTTAGQPKAPSATTHALEIVWHWLNAQAAGDIEPTLDWPLRADEIGTAERPGGSAHSLLEDHRRWLAVCGRFQAMLARTAAEAAGGSEQGRTAGAGLVALSPWLAVLSSGGARLGDGRRTIVVGGQQRATAPGELVPCRALSVVYGAGSRYQLAIGTTWQEELKKLSGLLRLVVGC